MNSTTNIDWASVITDLNRLGYSNGRIAAEMLMSKGWVAGLKNDGIEPRYRDGQMLLDLLAKANGSQVITSHGRLKIEPSPYLAGNNGDARDCADWLKACLAGEAVSTDEVRRRAEAAGYAWRTVQRAMRRAGAQSRRAGFGEPAKWFIATSGATAAP